MAPALFLCLLQASAPDEFVRWLDRLAQGYLEARQQTIARIRTRAEAEERQRAVLISLTAIHGGLPEREGPLNARITGSIPLEGYKVETLLFESFSGYLVSANVYVPASRGPHPAVLYTMGHWDNGKAAAQLIAGNLARKGFVVLAYDPPGQGERLLYRDKQTSRSTAGGSVEQHFQAGAVAILAGDSISRYFLQDGVRALDYLESRPDVDASRIGIFGCSGGGTQAAYLAAFDPRIRAAAIACYLNSFRELFRGPVGDCEQSLPGFLSGGFDQSDYVALFAPRPLLIASTQEDFFTPAGAKLIYEEAQRWYGLFGASDRIAWNLEPGPHGTPKRQREAIYAWMIRWLKNGEGDASEIDLPAMPDHTLWATPEGQVSQLGSRMLPDLVRERFRSRAEQGDAAALRAFVEKLVTPRTIGASPTPLRPGRTRIAVEPDVTAELETGVLPVQHLIAGQWPADRPAPPLGPGQARITLRAPRAAPRAKEAYAFSGEYAAPARAWLLGTALPALRARDILAAVRALSPGKAALLTLEAEGIWGIPALLAAAVEPRLGKVILRGTPHSFRQPIESGKLSRNLMESLIPGFALRWDLADLVRLIGPSRVEWFDPTDRMGNVEPLTGYFRYTARHPHPDSVGR